MYYQWLGVALWALSVSAVAAEDFQKTLAEAGIKPEVLEILVKNELTSREVLCLTTTEELTKIGIVLGQAKLIVKFCTPEKSPESVDVSKLSELELLNRLAANPKDSAALQALKEKPSVQKATAKTARWVVVNPDKKLNTEETVKYLTFLNKDTAAVQDVFKGNRTTFIEAALGLESDVASRSPSPNAQVTPDKTEPSQLPKTFTNSIGMEFVLVPAGEFMMGTNCPADDPFTDANEYENCLQQTGDGFPGHKVAVQSFYLGKYEVTQEQWVKVMGNHPAAFKKEEVGSDSRQHPVENVRWEDAQAFIERLNEMEKTDKYRLPSEAEWEYAARGGTQTAYFFGDDDAQLGDYAWYKKNAGGMTHPVGQKKPNPFGLYDILGNVGEWTQDMWHWNYEGAPTDGSAWMSDGKQNWHALRGGSCLHFGRDCRAAFRIRLDSRFNVVGFRVGISLAKTP